MWTLIDEHNVPVQVGQKLMLSDDLCTVTALGMPPHKNSSTGRIEIDGMLYFPSVVDCKWIWEEK